MASRLSLFMLGIQISGVFSGHDMLSETDLQDWIRKSRYLSKGYDGTLTLLLKLLAEQYQRASSSAMRLNQRVGGHQRRSGTSEAKLRCVKIFHVQSHAHASKEEYNLDVVRIENSFWYLMKDSLHRKKVTLWYAAHIRVKELNNEAGRRHRICIRKLQNLALI